MGKLFGTDGVRGIANVELTAEIAMKIGKAAASVLVKNTPVKAKILIGKDTRLSCDVLEGALVAGICSVGVDVVCLGVIPTPAVAFLVRKYHANAGIMISASHNSFEFNGIKIFGENGYKLPDNIESVIEKIVLDDMPVDVSEVTYAGLGTRTNSDNAIDDYIEHVASTIDDDLTGLKVAFDCANGAASQTAKKLFDRLGVECIIKNCRPNGTNINKNCGSMHIDDLARFVKENSLDAGLAFDGDADRCLAVDELGNIADGDFIMAVCAMSLNEQHKLAKSTVVGTVMTNIGFSHFCCENQLKFVATRVGDKYVLEEMLKNGYNFGGEQSGHVIFLDHSTTGDGQLTAVQLLSILKRSGKKLSELTGVMRKLPQVMLNVKVGNLGKLKFYADEEIKSAIDRVSAKFEPGNADTCGRGRILVRVSGTEPLIRIMLEGENLDRITVLANEVADLVKKRLS